MFVRPKPRASSIVVGAAPPPPPPQLLLLLLLLLLVAIGSAVGGGGGDVVGRPLHVDRTTGRIGPATAAGGAASAELLRIAIDARTVLNLNCTPSYFAIGAQSELVDFDGPERTEQRTRSTELKCRLLSVQPVDAAGPSPLGRHCRLPDTNAVQLGLFDAGAPRRFGVLAEACFDNRTDTLRLAWSPWGWSPTEAAAAAAVRVRDERLPPVDEDMVELQQLADELLDELSTTGIDADALWTDRPETRSFDAWERFAWNTFKMGPAYFELAAALMNERLPAIGRDIARRLQRPSDDDDAAADADDDDVLLYTGYMGNRMSFGDGAALGVSAPQYVWFGWVRRGDQRPAAAVVYVLANGAFAVDERQVGANRAEAGAEPGVYVIGVDDLQRHADPLVAAELPGQFAQL